MSSESVKNLEQFVELLKQENVIAYPTEAVFGLGCDPDSQKAVESLLTLKQRSWKKGLILIAANVQQLAPYIDTSRLSTEQMQRVLSTWPGPVTWIMPIKKGVPKWLTGEFDTLAVRVSAHFVVQALCSAFNKPIVSTSANLSGMEPCRTYQDVVSQFGVDFPVIDADVGGREKPSEIRDALTGQLIRQG